MVTKNNCPPFYDTIKMAGKMYMYISMYKLVYEKLSRNFSCKEMGLKLGDFSTVHKKATCLCSVVVHS